MGFRWLPMVQNVVIGDLLAKKKGISHYLYTILATLYTPKVMHPFLTKKVRSAWVSNANSWALGRKKM